MSCGCCKCCPNVGMVFAFIAVLGIFYSLAVPDWKRTWYYDSDGQYSEKFEGLWVVCTYEYQGSLCLWIKSSFLGLPPDLQAWRILTTVSSSLAVIGLIVGMFGLNCASVVNEDTRKKCTGRWGSMFMLLSGILCAIPVTWQAYNIWNYYYSNASSIPGTGIYVGWGASALALLAGFMSCCNNCTSSSEESPEKKGYMPLSQHPEMISQLYPSLIASNGVGMNSYNPALQPCTNVVTPTQNYQNGNPSGIAVQRLGQPILLA